MIEREHFQSWKHHPVTKVFFQFLRDRKESLIRESSLQWLNGSELFDRENQVNRGRALEAIELSEIEYEMIKAFYEKEEDGTETSEDDSRGVRPGEV